MKNLLLYIPLFWALQASAQYTSRFIAPLKTDSRYTAGQDSHFVALNKTGAIGLGDRLLVFLPGTGAETKHYKLITQTATKQNYHCINLSYPNDNGAALTCASSSDKNCYINLRREICFGTSLSPDVTVDSLNCISGRLTKLLIYLKTNFPNERWEQYLTNNETPDWSKIVFAGHSQGSGHALLFSKTFTLKRALLFGGPQDYEFFYQKTADWLKQAGTTPNNNIYSFIHLHDKVMSYEKQYEIVKDIGLASPIDSQTVDNSTSPYGLSHALYTDLAADHPGPVTAEHNAMIVDFYTPKSSNAKPLLEAVWIHLLDMPISKTAGILSGSFAAYPNPCTNNINVNKTVLKSETLEIHSTQGTLIQEFDIKGDRNEIDISHLPAGCYILKIGNSYQKIIKL